MKRILLIMVMLLTVVGAKAQVTMNARVGAGMITDYPGMVGSFQVNVPFRRGRRFTFSPSVEFDGAICPDNGDPKQEDEYVSKMLLFPLHLGCKFSLGSKVILFPKWGVAVGSDIEADDACFVFGPSTELSLEYKHFVVGIGGFYSLPETTKYGYYSYYEDYYNPWKFTISLGYKF